MVTLKEWRRKKAITIRELAKLAQVSTATITHIEQGKQLARPITMRKIAAALNLKPEQIDFE